MGRVRYCTVGRSRSPLSRFLTYYAPCDVLVYLVSHVRLIFALPSCGALDRPGRGASGANDYRGWWALMFGFQMIGRIVDSYERQFLIFQGS